MAREKGRPPGAGGAAVVSPALHRGEREWPFHIESRRDGANDFSSRERAEGFSNTTVPR